MSVTIPAACVEALGNLVDEDPPILYIHDEAGTLSHHPLDDTWIDSPAVRRLLLPQSAPALLRVLARHVGSSPRVGSLTWRLLETRKGTGWLLDCGDSHMSFSASPGWVQDYEATLAPTLTPDMTPMRALAEVFVHLARVERVTREFGWASDTEATDLFLATMEQSAGFPEWRVDGES